MNSEDILISRLNLYKGAYSLFVGSGISVCAGIPLASVDLPSMPSIVSHIRRDFYNSLGKSHINDAELLAWYVDQKLLQRPHTIYSDALNLIGDTSRARQRYLKRFFEGKEPGICHKSIAKLIEHKYLEVIFTTNFDPLVEEAIRNNGNCARPKVAAHSNSVKDVLITEPGPKVIKLHGDYLFSDIRTVEAETKKLTDDMRNKLRSFLNEHGLWVIGYSGNDDSVMKVFEEMNYDGGFFPYGLYWLYIEGHPPTDRVASFVREAGGQLLQINSAESLLEELARRFGMV